MPIEVAAITPEIGAEVTGVELARPLDEATVDALRAALLEHLVLLFRDQPMTPEQQLALGRAFGEIQRPPVKTRHGDDPEINVLDQTSPRGEGADSWHADHTYTERPAMGSILRAVRVPSVGGDTLFASMYAAHDALSEPMQRLLAGLTAEHDITRSAMRGIRAGHLKTDLRALQRRLPPVTHPVVRTHPETGRKALFVNGNSTVRICELFCSFCASVTRAPRCSTCCSITSTGRSSRCAGAGTQTRSPCSTIAAPSTTPSPTMPSVASCTA